MFVALAVLIAGIIISFVAFKKPTTWVVLGITLGAFLFIILVSLWIRACDKSSWLNKRQMALQLIVHQSNIGLLKDKHCHVNIGVYGSYLKFIFTVKTLNVTYLISSLSIQSRSRSWAKMCSS